jgi:hypothetical protein
MGHRISRSAIPWLANVAVDVEQRQWLARFAVTSVDHVIHIPKEAHAEIYDLASAFWQYVLRCIPPEK